MPLRTFRERAALLGNSVNRSYRSESNCSKNQESSMISEHVIYMYFAAAHDWTLAPGSLRTGWQAVYKGPLYDYHVHFDVDEEWVYLQCPLLMMEVLPECKLALYEYMLRANN